MQNTAAPIGALGLALPVPTIGLRKHGRRSTNVQVPAGTPTACAEQSALVLHDKMPAPLARTTASQLLPSGPVVHVPIPPPASLHARPSQLFGFGTFPLLGELHVDGLHTPRSAGLQSPLVRQDLE